MYSAIDATQSLNLALNGSRLYRDALAFTGESTANTKQSTAQSTTGDSLALSPAMQALSSTGLQQRASYAAVSSSRLDFDLSYAARAGESLSADGYYAFEERSLNLSLKYTLERAELVDGVLQVRSFEASIEIRAERFESYSIREFSEKEDVVGFVRRVVDEILAIAKDDDKILKGVAFDAEDLADIAAVEDGELAKVVSAIISMATHLAAMRQLSRESAENAEGVILQPERAKFQGVTEESLQQSEFSFNLSLREIRSEQQPAEAPAPADE